MILAHLLKDMPRTGTCQRPDVDPDLWSGTPCEMEAARLLCLQCPALIECAAWRATVLAEDPRYFAGSVVAGIVHGARSRTHRVWPPAPDGQEWCTACARLCWSGAAGRLSSHCKPCHNANATTSKKRKRT